MSSFEPVCLCDVVRPTDFDHAETAPHVPIIGRVETELIQPVRDDVSGIPVAAPARHLVDSGHYLMVID